MGWFRILLLVIGYKCIISVQEGLTSNALQALGMLYCCWISQWEDSVLFNQFYETGKNNFSWPWDRAPRLLKLTPLDSHLAGANYKFKNAQLSWVTKNRKQEHHLVGTVGKFSVIWDFQQIKLACMCIWQHYYCNDLPFAS
ncbi:Protein CYPRO4 [Gossypium arboreum]|uniref:Protein CYPRO4 n=1 Tax=Gossypium arboreum TaxID=29729 RepID=A0A0B0MJK8_GOSAR|nr:Protein CYPRO4 [Gossypium arboreum]